MLRPPPERNALFDKTWESMMTRLEADWSYPEQSKMKITKKKKKKKKEKKKKKN